MLIVTMVEKQPKDFNPLAQNMLTLEICGTTEQTGFKEVQDIPQGFSQRVLPPQYGDCLNINQIATGLMLENKALQKQSEAIDEIFIMLPTLGV